ncbi:MAG: carbohydrate binding family 9 domain-containing protein [Gemmatimonadales bacterium]|nr:carbohydrate binding family 9 domain-containing protein [Gemmatimonadales bacterium]
MPIPVLAALALLLPTDPPKGGVFNGRLGQVDVTPPRLEQSVTVDGVLNEPAWGEAALLTGFSQYQPTDRRPSTDSTEVLVWYSPTAIHFGIRAYAPAGAVRATVADRDRISQDDQVQLFLGTFNDSRQAMWFAVNPLGIQSDGVLNETGVTGGGGFGRGAAVRESPDLAPDFVWKSKGRVTEFGYEVEISIPFKSIRYLGGEQQTWQLNVLRVVQARGHEQTWTPVKRGNASFLAQSGRLTQLRELRRGLVLDLIPTVTERVNGVAPSPAPGPWTYSVPAPELGGTMRWGVTNNLTMTGTARPDFSDVEADATQFAIDPRVAVFFPERRPFFLEGIEQFGLPNQIVYTRRVVQPVGAVKLTGKASGFDIGLLSAVDARTTSATGLDNPVFNILRLQRDIGRQSRIGMVYTDKIDGGSWNRVGGMDTRLVFGRIFALQFQGALTATGAPGVSDALAPLWDLRFNVSGRRLALRYQFRGISPRFDAQAGFIPRPGIVRIGGDHRFTTFGKPGAFLESYTVGFMTDGTWRYDEFVNGRDVQDLKFHVNTNYRLRGGWGVGASVFIERFGYDPGLYQNYVLLRPRPQSRLVDTIPYTGTPTLPNLDWVLAFNTPQWKAFSLDVSAIWGQDQNFFEWSSASIYILNTTLNLRPTRQLRVAGTWNFEAYDRVGDGTRVATRNVPRVRMEYQLSRTIFVRFIGEYALQRVDSLRDYSRTDLPIYFRNASTGALTRAGATRSARVRGDFLFSYFPNPGTVLYAGYGAILRNGDPRGDGDFRRTQDGFFLKLSYLFRM